MKFLYGHLCNQQANTFYPDAERKSHTAIIADNLRWMLKYHEINHFYYFYGLDRKNGVNESDFMGLRTFRKLRNQINMSGWIANRRTNYTCILRDKFVFGQYLGSLGFPTPKILALCDNESVTWFDSLKTEPLENLPRQKKVDGFLKEVLGECADGVFPLQVEQGKLYLDGREASIDKLQETMNGECIIQERVLQHDRLNELYRDSVNTIRLITARQDEKVIPLGAIIRTGTNGERRDNSAAGGISVGVKLETGELFETGIYQPGLGQTTKQHPNTEVKFAGFVVPYFAEAMQLAIEAHDFLYGVHSIGWDIAITQKGPTFIEGNDNWEIPTFMVYDSQFKDKYVATLPRKKGR